MTIGILTYHWVANFGANLQTLSTFAYFKSKGFNVRIINWIPFDLEKHYELVATKEQLEAHKSFRESYFEMTRLCRSSSDIVDVIREEGINLVVIGSDAVLTYVPFRKQFVLSKKGLIRNKPYSDSILPNPYWGDFLSKIKVNCVLMSASAQNTDFPKRFLCFDRKKVGNLINKMRYISVRDVWTQKMLAYLTDNQVIAPITPDPVFAFNNNVSGIVNPQIEMNCKKKFGLGEENEKYILFSVDNKILPDEWVSQFEEIATARNYKVVELPRSIGVQNTVLKNKITLPLDPLEWYYLIKNASGYVGVLMHPVLVALHNTVPVYSIDTYGFLKHNELDTESSKIYHIMNRFDLIQNYYNIKSGKPIPTPEEVLYALCSFNLEKCKIMANLLYYEYLEMMNNIITV